MNHARFDIAFLAMSLSFSLGIGVTEVVHQTSSIETRSEPKAPPLRELQPVKPGWNLQSSSNCRSPELDHLSLLYDEMKRERNSIEDPRLIPRGKVKKKIAELDRKLKQLKLYLDEHRYIHYNGDHFQDLVYREKCYDF